MDTWRIVRIIACFVVPIVAAASAQGLLALWAATSRTHWFVRALAVWCGVMLLVPIRAYEPAAIFALSGPLIVAVIVLSRWGRQKYSLPEKGIEPRERTGRLRYDLRDLFLLTVFVALILVGWRVIDRGYDRHDWLAFLTSGFALAVTILFGYAAVVARPRWLLAVALVAVVVAIPFAISATAPRTKAVLVWNAAGALWGQRYSPSELSILSALHGAVGLITVLAVACVVGTRKEPGVWRNIARGGLVVLTLTFGGPLVWLYWQMLWLTPFPPPIASSSNQYSRLLAIADALGGNRGKGPAPNANPRALIAEAESLLQHPHSVVWNERALTRSGLDDHSDAASAMRELSRIFDADSTAAAMAGRFDRGAELGMANLRLGTAMNRGGNEIDALVGLSCIRVGLTRIAEVRQSLSSSACGAIIGQLEQSLRELESIENISARDAAYSERAYGWSDRYERLLVEQVHGMQVGTVMLKNARRSTETLNVLLQTDLAIRLFRAKHQRLPNNLAELVPSCLPAVPIDPYSGSPLCYSAENGKFVLYSVGSDARDDGGRFFPKRYSQPVAGYDFDLDTLTRP